MARARLSIETLRCLAEIHDWELRPSLVTEVGVWGHVGNNGIKIAQQCDYCDSLRFRVVSRSTGELLYVTYQHSDQYRAALDEGLTKAQARLRYYKQITDKKEAA